MTKEELMRKAIELSVRNVAEGGGPFGSVIARNGEIIATGTNRVTPDHDPTAHAEVSAIRAACRILRKKKGREARNPRSFFIFIPFSFAFNIKMYDPERSYINLFTYIQKNSNPLSTCHVFPDTHVVVLHFQKTCYKNFLHSFKHASYLFLCFTTQNYRFAPYVVMLYNIYLSKSAEFLM